jgi:acetyl-CoA synthetase
MMMFCGPEMGEGEERGELEWRSFVDETRRRGGIPFAEQWARFRECYRGRSPAKPPIAWWPDEATRERANLTSLMNELGLERYRDLYRWSVENKTLFWEIVLRRLGVVLDVPPRAILDLSRGERDPEWLPGARLDITASCFGAEPDETAIVYRGDDDGAIATVSYRELESQVNRVASGLREHGLAPGDSVALYMPMTAECVAAYLGIVRAGLRVVSIADSFSPDELRKRMTIADARTVVTLSRYRRAGREIDLYRKVREALSDPSFPARAIVLEPEELQAGDLSWEDFLSASDGASTFVSGPDRVTNVLFSSGTTGTPKAIPWTQLTPLKCSMDAHFHQDVHPGDVLCWPTNVGWMMGPWLIYGTLLNRAAMALYPGAPGGEGFARFVRDAGVTMLGVVPSMVRSWRAENSVDEDVFGGVRLFSSTGEASSAEDYLWLMSRTGYHAPVIEYLGGTEIGGGHLTGTVLQPASPSTFTTPALGVDFFVLDEGGLPVAEGGSGELFLVPPAMGMSQRLLNASHDDVYFQGCPKGPKGETLRRHGDQVQILAGGNYKASGRSDDTMNLGGIKVGSLELERLVNGHPAVLESAAVSVPSGDEDGGAEALVIFVVLREPAGREALAREIQRSIARRMNPLFKVRELVVVESLPRTASNKIMRRELRASHRGGRS